MPCPFRFFCSFFLAMRSNRRRLPVPRYLVFLFVPSFYFSLFFSFTEFRHLGPGRWAGPFRRGREGTKKKNWKKKKRNPKLKRRQVEKKERKKKKNEGGNGNGVELCYHRGGKVVQQQQQQQQQQKQHHQAIIENGREEAEKENARKK